MSKKAKILHDPIAYKQRLMSETFAGPRKEQATCGRFMEAGSDYGVGKAQNIGSLKVKGMNQGPIPMESECFPCDEAIRK